LLVIVAAHSLVSFVFLHSDEISLFKVAVNRYFSTSC
jgi:signal transduction histidine kinase